MFYVCEAEDFHSNELMVDKKCVFDVLFLWESFIKLMET